MFVSSSAFHHHRHRRFVRRWTALRSTVTVVISFEQSGNMSVFRWFDIAVSSVSPCLGADAC